jgi:hypothetical protein
MMGERLNRLLVGPMVSRGQWPSAQFDMVGSVGEMVAGFDYVDCLA